MIAVEILGRLRERRAMDAAPGVDENGRLVGLLGRASPPCVLMNEV